MMEIIGKKKKKKTLICISNISDVHGYFLVTAVWHPLLGSPNQLTGSLTQFKLQCEDFTPLCCLPIRLAEISFCFLSHLLFHCVQLSMVCAHSINLSHCLYASKLNESTTVATVSTGPQQYYSSLLHRIVRGKLHYERLLIHANSHIVS